MDSYTYGKTPAAVYLADRLAQLNKPLVTKRTGKILTGWRNTLSELEKSNNSGLLSAHNLARVVSSMRSGFHVDVGDELISNLVTNILVGEMKILLRKSCDIRKIETQQKKILGNQEQMKKLINNAAFFNRKGYKVANFSDSDFNFPKYTVSDVKEDINAETLTEKWKVKMKRKNIDIPNK